MCVCFLYFFFPPLPVAVAAFVNWVMCCGKLAMTMAQTCQPALPPLTPPSLSPSSPLAIVIMMIKFTVHCQAQEAVRKYKKWKKVSQSEVIEPVAANYWNIERKKKKKKAKKCSGSGVLRRVGNGVELVHPILIQYPRKECLLSFFRPLVLVFYIIFLFFFFVGFSNFVLLLSVCLWCVCVCDTKINWLLTRPK